MSVTPQFQNDPPLYTIKILLLGESSVGKSSIVNRYTNHTFQSNGLLTIGIEVKKIIKQVRGKKIRLERSTSSMQFGTRLVSKNIAPYPLNTIAASKAFSSSMTSPITTLLHASRSGSGK
jgi:GTPase SAR1 family protein